MSLLLRFKRQQTLEVLKEIKTCGLPDAYYLFIASFSAWFIAKDFRTLLHDLWSENQATRKSQKEIRRIVTLDPLTGLSNRVNAEQTFNKLAMVEEKLSVVFIDLDNFKPINDAYGHHYGDIALKILAERLLKHLEPDEICCRFGGDEFVLVLKYTNAQYCKLRYQALLETIAEEMEVELRAFRISASIGVAHFPNHSTNFNELCRLADQAMYRSKLSGKNTALLYQPQWQDEHRKKLDMIHALRLAIAHNELFLVYQPKFHLASLSINGVEALLRWQSKEFGLVSPAVFIPLAEETGLIDDIGLFVLRQACDDCKKWLEKGHDVPVSVNLSAAQLSSGMLPDHIFKILSESGLAPHYLELEITESLLMQDQQGIDSQISMLNDKGISFAIDDFGTGYSNLHYLSRFKAATLKIDQSFVRQLNELSKNYSLKNYSLVKGIIVLAKTLGLTTIAEGVEDQDTLNILRAMKCESVQGYLLSKPVSLDDLFTKFKNQEQETMR
jgi:diguanylate cyclase